MLRKTCGIGHGVAVLWAAVLTLGCTASVAWGISGEEIIRKALDLNKEIADYRAEVAVTTDIEGVDIPVRHITVYYKRPDKMRVDSKGVVFVPKAAIGLHSLGTLITESNRCVLAGEKQVNGRQLYFVRALPPEGSDDDERVLVWIWGDNWTVQKLQVFRGQQQLFQVRWVYQRIVDEYWMPKWIIFTASTGRLPGRKRGEVTLHFSKIEVNLGLKDDIFEQE